MLPRALRFALVALVFTAPGVAAAAALPEGPLDASAPACGVPCGYIYPLILLTVEGKNEPRALAAGESLTIPATITYRFDVVNEGFTVPDPQQPIVITFEYPKKPEWATLSVEPAQIEVPIQPQYIQPDASDPQNLQGQYVFVTDIAITVAAPGQAVLADGFDYAKLLVFAKSTESGLYKAGYGIKELRMQPEGAVHASELASAPARVVADVAPATFEASTLRAPGVTLTLTPPAGPVLAWESAEFELVAEASAPDALPLGIVATLLDESGVAHYSTGLRTPQDGRLALSLTLPGVGMHTLAVLVAPPPGGVAALATQAFAFPLLVAPPAGADAVRMPEAFVAGFSELVTGASGSAEPLAQFTKDLAFPVLPGSSGATVALALRTDGAPPLPTGPGSVSFQLLDPEGAVVLQGGADSANAAREYDAGALPGQGLYRLRVSGAGVPFVTAFDAMVTVSYDDPPVADVAQDGVADAVLSPVAIGAVSVTIAQPDAIAPWVAAPLAFSLAGFDGAAVSYSATIVDSAGALVYSSHFRVGDPVGFAVPFLAPAPGDYTALLFVQPGSSGVRGFEGTVLAFPLRAGTPDAATTTLPATLELADAGTVAAHSSTSVAMQQRVRVLDGASPIAVSVGALPRPGGAILVRALDADGNVAAEASGAQASLDGLAPGEYVVQVVIDTAGETAFEAALSASYATPPVLENPLFPAGEAPAPRSFLPAPASALVFAALAAVALAGSRRGK